MGFDQVVKWFDEQTKAAAEKTKDLNLEIEEHPKMVQISTALEPHEEKEIKAVLLEY